MIDLTKRFLIYLSLLSVFSLNSAFTKPCDSEFCRNSQEIQREINTTHKAWKSLHAFNKRNKIIDHDNNQRSDLQARWT